MLTTQRKIPAAIRSKLVHIAKAQAELAKLAREVEAALKLDGAIDADGWSIAMHLNQHGSPSTADELIRVVETYTPQ